MKHPYITVITVTYNALPQLKKTIFSIDSQDYDLMEMVIIDGASTDDTVDYLSTLKVKHSIQWVSEPDKGIYDAMNKGIKKAKGDYCIFMNAADTFVNTTTLSQVVNSNMDADIIYGNIIKCGKLVEAKEPMNSHKMYYCHQSAFVSTSCLKEYPFDIKHKMSADFKQSKLLYLNGKSFKHIPIPIAIYDTNGISNTKRSKGLWDNIMVIYEVDNLKCRWYFLPRLLFTYCMCILRGK